MSVSGRSHPCSPARRCSWPTTATACATWRCRASSTTSRASDAAAAFLSVRPAHSFHVVLSEEDGAVASLKSADQAGLWINGGFFVLRNEIFEYMRQGEELVEEPFLRLVEERRLFTRRHEGFWKSMDTYKDKVEFDTMLAAGDTPWMVWQNGRANCRPPGR